jgi:aldo/keto reductase family protein
MRSSHGRCLPGLRVTERPHGAGSGCLTSQQLVGNGRATNNVALPFPLAPDAGHAGGGTRTPETRIVLLRWCVQRELVVIPKSTHRERIEENAQIFDFTLFDEDMAALDALDETGGTDRALERPWW